jgi:hypothetical protein
LPREGLAEKSRVDHTPFDVWARQGHLHTTPGRTIDLDFVAHELHEVLRAQRQAHWLRSLELGFLQAFIAARRLY